MKKARRRSEASEAQGHIRNPVGSLAVVHATDSMPGENHIESIKPVIWIDLNPGEYDCKSETAWVRDRLELHCKLEVICVSDWQLGITQVAARLQQNEQNMEIPIVIASRYRSDAVVQFLNGLQKLIPSGHVTYLLGQWWAGHKRTFLLPNGHSAYYWYQLYDGFLNDLALLHTSRPERESALVISTNPELRRMWTDSLPNESIHVTSLVERWSLPDSPFSYIIFDADIPTNLEPDSRGGEPESPTSFIRNLRRRYPNSTIAALFGFPEWSSTRGSLEAGADIVIGKPFLWSNFLSSLRSHSRSLQNQLA